jgi:Arc/MetJ family transcription regulator
MLRERLALAPGTQKVQIGAMKTSVDLDEELAAEVERAVELIREKPATVIRLAIRAGLPVIANRFQTPHPEGYFETDYKQAHRARFEQDMGKATVQKPER